MPHIDWIKMFTIAEIFETLQGEGRNCGRKCVFLRFSGCNLQCPWCDTDFSAKMALNIESLLNELEKFPTKSIILTGGEPLLQPDFCELVLELKTRGYWIGIETNGTKSLKHGIEKSIDYVATSPKLDIKSPINLQAANEVRLVVKEDTDEIFEKCKAIRAKIPAEDYFLSPCENKGYMPFLPVMRLLGKLNSELPKDSSPWRLSLQMHKLAGIQ